MTQEEWNSANDVFAMFKHLRELGVLDRQLWRTFHCICSRSIWGFITDDRGRRAVEVAEQYLRGNSTRVDLVNAYAVVHAAQTEAWEAVAALREPGGPASWSWPLTDEVDRAWEKYCAIGAAKDCVRDDADDVLFTLIPESAASVRPWAESRADVLRQQPYLPPDEFRQRVLELWEEMRREQERLQAGVLRELVTGRRISH